MIEHDLSSKYYHPWMAGAISGAAGQYVCWDETQTRVIGIGTTLDEAYKILSVATSTELENSTEITKLTVTEWVQLLKAGLTYNKIVWLLKAGMI